MDCLYCSFYGNKASRNVLNLSSALAAVDWMAEHVSAMGQSVLEVHFFGGEPFVAPDVVEAAVHRARQRAAELGLTTRLEVTTNGLFSEDICAFVSDYFDAVVLSCDGPEDVQNRNRPPRHGHDGSATVTRNARALSTSGVDVCIRTCVTEDTVMHLEDMAGWFYENVHPSVICFEPLQATEESECHGLRAPDPWDFSRAYVRAATAASQLGISPVYHAASINELRWSFCPLGSDTPIVTPDCRVAGCYLPEETWRRRGLDLNFGRLEPSGAMAIDQKALDRLRQVPAHRGRCLHCLARWHCAGGCHVNQSYPGCSDSYNDFCIRTRIITVCSLLEALDQRHLVDRLLEDRSAMEDLALHPSDRIGHLEESHS